MRKMRAREQQFDESLQRPRNERLPMPNNDTHESPASEPGALHVVRGFLMGGADIIPGVSGGTVALIVGIYQRLVTAISRFDTQFVRHLAKRNWGQAAERVDAGFLGLLGLGIGAGIVSLASLMHWLLEEEMQHTFAAFFGMILVSSWIVARLVGRWSPLNVILVLVGAVLAYQLVGLPFLESPPEGELYIFVCGLIAICAMILPGISGSFILLLLGTYTVITGALRACLHGDLAWSNFAVIGSFAGGAAIGLIAFSKLLKWLLQHYQAATMAVLCGFMIGSLRKIWPFKKVTGEAAEFKDREFVNIVPDVNTADTWVSLGILLAAAAFVFLLDFVASKRGAGDETATVVRRSRSQESRVKSPEPDASD